ncbi:MAG: diaminopimelate dehydrogenase [Eubacteriales bacterium]
MIRIAIAGYGNLGRGTELAVQKNPDMKLVAVFSRRDPKSLKPLDPSVPVYALSDAAAHKDEVDVLIICGGSATDLPEMTPALAKHFNVIDSFDTHAHIPEHFDHVNAAAKESGHIAMISVGWDPGMFSVARLYGMSILPDGADYTFWGRGVSQGHSDAIRRIPGVRDARQYTVPVPEALERVRSGEQPVLTTREKHTRECYVVAYEDADKAAIETAIKTMPDYFADYDTTVRFISMEELREKHMGIPHGGMVIRSGKTGADNENTHVIEYKLTLDSNPEFTAGVLAAYARAAKRMHDRGITGCKTVFDVAPIDLAPVSPEEARSHLL